MEMLTADYADYADGIALPPCGERPAARPARDIVDPAILKSQNPGVFSGQAKRGVTPCYICVISVVCRS
jgi:hypothetical protein